MGAVVSTLGSAAASVGGCCATSLCACGCSSLGRAAPKGPMARLPYMLLLFVTALVAILFREYGTATLANLYVDKIQMCSSETCAGNQGVMRFSFAMSCFTALTLLISVMPGSDAFFRGWWPIKLIAYFGFTVGVFYMPNNALQGYTYLARFGGGVFLLLQLIALIDFAYAWNQSWVDKEQKRYFAGLLVASIVMWAGSITLWVFAFHWFTTTAACTLQSAVIVVTIILCVGLTLLSVSSHIEHGSLLPASVLTLYSTYTLFSALRADPSVCNSFGGSYTSYSQVVLSTLLAAASITYATFSLSRTTLLSTEASGASERLLEPEDETGSVNSDQHSIPIERGVSPDTSETDSPEKGKAYFLVVVLMGSMYMGCILTDWGSNMSTGASDADVGKHTLWITLASQWTGIFMYAWTLLAPICFPNRDFN